MKNTTQLLFILTLLCSTLSKAQDPFYYDKAEKEYKITKDTPKKIIDKYLELNELKTIEFNPDTSSIYPFRVQYNSGDWALIDSWNWEVYSKKKYSLTFPQTELEEVGFTVAIRKGKKYLYSFGGKYLSDFAFDDMNLYQVTDTVYYFNTTQQKHIETIENHLCIALKSKGKWGMVYIARDEYASSISGDLYQLTPFNYGNYDDLPLASISRLICEANDLVAKGLLDERTDIFQGIDRLASEDNYTKIIFNPDVYSDYPFKIKHKKGHWGLGDKSGVFIGWNNVSIDFPNKLGFSVAKEKDKKYVLLLNEDQGQYTLDRSLWFDSLVIRTRLDTNEFEYYDEEKDDIVWKKEISEVYDGLAIQREHKCALAHYDNHTHQMHLLSGFHFSSAKTLPDSLLNHYNHYEYEYPRLRQHEQMKVVSDFLKENKEVDIATFFGYYTYSENEKRTILLVRHATTERWSIQIPSGFRSETELPVATNAIKLHKYGNEVVVETWCDDKVGYYFYNGEDIRKILPCEYDDFRFIHLDYTRGCAVKKNGYWEIYYMDNPEKHVVGKAKTIEEVKELWWNR